MIPDHDYVRRLGLATLLVVAVLAGCIWFFPKWQPPAAAPQPAAPRVFFLSQGSYTSAEQAAIWSPATIALPGAPARRAADTGENLITPPLDFVPTLPAPPAAEMSAPAGDPRRGLSLFHDYLGQQAFRLQAGDMPAAPATAAANPAAAVCELSFSGAAPTPTLDYSQVDISALPAPTGPCAATIQLDFDEHGNAARVLLETPTGQPALDAELVRQAWRIRRQPGPHPQASHTRTGRLHILFPGP